ncbi:MAG: hypothetical protein MUC43_19605 [Pirellula sp.]|jgi:hypothetical protein|nr:hypothetical protein [Pirellula sp.]
MKIAATVATTLLALIGLGSFNRCLAQQDELVADLLRNVSWPDKVKSHRLEIRVTEQRESDRPRWEHEGRVLNPKSSFYEYVRIAELISNHETKSVSVVCSYGVSSVDFRSEESGVKEEVEDEGDTRFVICDNEYLKEFDFQRQTREVSPRSGKDSFEILKYVTPALNLSFFPLMLFQDHALSETEIERIIEQMVDTQAAVGAGKMSVQVEDGKRDGKPVRIWRLTSRGDELTVGYRIIISHDGFDKGMVLEFHSGVLKPEEAKMPYSNEDQFSDAYVTSNFITWKQFRSEKSGEEWVLPITVVKTVKNRLSGSMKGTINSSFEWKGFDPPDPKLMEVDNLIAVGKDFKKRIDVKLRR